MITRILLLTTGIILTLIALVLLVLLYQGTRNPRTDGEYVAMGSSFAAGFGLGPREPGSPFVCMRSTNGYPQLLARMTGLSLVDVSCSGSTTAHILNGGQMFLGAQLDAVGPKTRLVTITSGGNDLNYIGDLFRAAGVTSTWGKLMSKGPQPIERRDFAKVRDNFVAIMKRVRARAPAATIVLVSYPPVMPLHGTCDKLGIDEKMADLSRQVAAGLQEATRGAAEQSGVLFGDMGTAGIGHDACSVEPWVNGSAPASGKAFHPSAAGAKATAQEVLKLIRQTGEAR